MHLAVRSLLVVFTLLLLGSLVLSYGGGAAQRGSRGCGSCHGSQPNANGKVTVSIQSAIALQTGSTIPVTLTVTGGPAGTTGGFSLDTNGGTLKAGTNSKVSSGSLTHSNKSARSWKFSFTGTKTLQGYVSGDPVEPIVPTTWDPAELNLTMSFDHLRMWTEPGENEIVN